MFIAPDALMNEETRQRVKAIKAGVSTMLAERQAIREPTASPSSYWTDFCSAFDYMLGMDESAFLKLRYHTYHFNAETYQTYYFGDADQFWAANHLTEFSRDIPADLLIDEPPGGIGFRCPTGRFISEDTVRFQKVIYALYRCGTLRPLQERKSCTILEIGAGYGGLAHHVGRIVPGGAYVIVDLPESLLFSATYLSLNDPTKRTYVYSPRDDLNRVLARIKDGAFDFALLPNYKLEALRPLSFDLVLNMASFQEMKSRQVEQYLDFIRDTCEGAFYSRNQDRQPRNRELSSLNAMMRSRFAMTEIAEWQPPRSAGAMIKRYLRQAAVSLAAALGLTGSGASKDEVNNPYRQFICVPAKL